MQKKKKNIKKKPFVKKQPRVVLWVVLCFLLPILLASYLYHHYAVFHFKTVNKGTLVSPPVAVSQAPWILPMGNQALRFQQLQPSWLVFYLQTSCSIDTLKTQITAAAQLRKALGNNRRSLQALILVPAACNLLPSLVSAQIAAEEGVQWGYYSPPTLTFLGASVQTNAYYIVDPKGFLVMAYKPSAPLSDVLADVERLVKISLGHLEGL